jgi:flagellar biosynthetic protein FlhB
MPDDFFQERTEPATPRRRHEARQEGKVARSQELGSAFVLLAGIGLLAVIGPFMLQRLAGICRALLGESGHIELRADLLLGYFARGVPYVLWTLAPLTAAILAIGLLVNLAQVGFVLSWKPLRPRLDALSPTRGFARIVSKHGAMELAKSLLKVVLISWIAYLTLRAEIPRLTSMAGGGALGIFGYAALLALKLGLRVALAILFLALFDYGFQRWDYEKNIMMTRREVEEELRQTEGDPRVRARVRSAQREMARRRMMEAVKTADVVVTNPTRLAVALRYDRARMRAPKVVARGARLVAARIREIARQHGVPIVEDPPLARLLYKVEVDSEIPVALFRVVAELLAHVYRLKERRTRWALGTAV